MTELRFEVPGPPVPKARARAGRNGKHYTPEKTKRYESAVALSAVVALQHNGGRKAWPLDRKYALGVTAYMPDRRGRDLSNVEKSVEDGLNGILWKDDRQVVRRLDVPGVELDRENPRTVVVVRILEDA